MVHGILGLDLAVHAYEEAGEEEDAADEGDRLVGRQLRFVVHEATFSGVLRGTEEKSHVSHVRCE